MHITKNEQENSSLVKEIIKSKCGKYTPAVRSFSLTLHFYSPRGYEFVRDAFKKDNLPLPHVSTIRKWYSTVDGKPGFSSEAMNMLSKKSAEAKEKSSEVLCCLMVDEMKIKKQIIFDKGTKRIFGYCDIAGEIIYTGDSIPEATDAYVFMVTAVNGGWKLAIGYFMITSLTGTERAHLIRQALHQLHLAGVKVVALTTDGPKCNINMAERLGCCLNPFSHDFTTTFINEATNEKISYILDVAHMVKLVRNVFGTLGRLLDFENRIVNWRFIELLEAYQTTHGLVAATRLKTRHIEWRREKMKVLLAVQTLSNRVADALEYLDLELKEPEFHEARYTARFLRMFNNLFDVLNSKTKFGIMFKRPITEKSFDFHLKFFEECKFYIFNIKKLDGTPILSTQQHTGFLGFIVAMESFKNIYSQHKVNLPYILTFKFSQDHLETFFSAIRGRGGYNNNPNALQFESAYKRLLMRNDVKASLNGNCEVNDISILHVSSSTIKVINKDYDSCENSEKENEEYNEIDEIVELKNDLSDDLLSEYINDVVSYISGFVERVIYNKIKCEECIKAFEKEEKIQNNFITFKDRGGLVSPRKTLYKICLLAEREVRSYTNLSEVNYFKKLVLKVMRKALNENFFNELSIHQSSNCIDDHRYLLIRLITEQYCKIRLNHECLKKNAILQKNTFRKINTKLVHFRNQ